MCNFSNCKMKIAHYKLCKFFNCKNTLNRWCISNCTVYIVQLLQLQKDSKWKVGALSHSGESEVLFRPAIIYLWVSAGKSHQLDEKGRKFNFLSGPFCPVALLRLPDKLLCHQFCSVYQTSDIKTLLMFDKNIWTLNSINFDVFTYIGKKQNIGGIK